MEQSVTREEFERVARALLYPEDADDVMAAYDTGWQGFQLFTPFSLGLAAVSSAHAALLIKLRPAIAEQIAEYQRDPDAALAELKRQMES